MKPLIMEDILFGYEARRCFNSSSGGLYGMTVYIQGWRQLPKRGGVNLSLVPGPYSPPPPMMMQEEGRMRRGRQGSKAL